MSEKTTFYRRHITVIYLMGGLLLGAFLGYTAPRVVAEPVVENSAQRRAQLDGFESRIEASLAALSSVKVVDVTLKDSVFPAGKHYMSAVVVLSVSGPEPLSSTQVANITQLITTSADGLADHRVNLMDDTGRSLNLEQRQADERKRFWTGIAINVAKVLGVLAALITLRFIIEAIGKGIEGAEVEKK